MKKILLTLLAPLCLLANDNNMGIEINPFRLLLNDEDTSSFSGAFSYFLVDQNAEIRFPIFWRKDTRESYNGIHSLERNTEIQSTIDVEYRYFTNAEVIGGLFVGAVARYAYLSNEKNERLDRSTNKFGLGITGGYRYMPEGSNWYWGASITVIRYLHGENNIFEGGDTNIAWVDNDAPAVISIDFFKIGYRF